MWHAWPFVVGARSAAIASVYLYLPAARRRLLLFFAEIVVATLLSCTWHAGPQ